jgi:hypothetical protein
MIELSLWLTYSTYSNAREKRKKTTTKKKKVMCVNYTTTRLQHTEFFNDAVSYSVHIERPIDERTYMEHLCNDNNSNIQDYSK